MDTLIETILAVIISWWFIVPLSMLTVFCDYHEAKKDNCGWTVFYALVLTTALCLVFKPSLVVVGITAVLWVPIGLCWSLFKWKLRVTKIGYKIKSGEIVKDSSGYERALNKINIDRAKGIVVFWVLFWPINIISTCFINVFEFIEYIITVKMGSIFKKMAQDAIK